MIDAALGERFTPHLHNTEFIDAVRLKREPVQISSALCFFIDSLGTDKIGYGYKF